MPAKPRSYRSTAAAPKQQKFTHRRQTVRTYGRRNPSRELRQGTLTQMDFASSAQPDFTIIDSEAEEQEEEEDEEKGEEEAKKLVTTKQDKKKKAKNTRNSRRKTTGDELDMEEQPRNPKRRRTLGDAPSTNVSSSFHTQTLTQFLSNKDENEDIWQINDSNDEGEEELALVMETPKKKKKEYGEDSKLLGTEGKTDSAVPSLIKSVTPTNRQKKTEIPSSQSPITPMLMRFSPAADHSPLKSKSTKAIALSPAIKKLQKTPLGAVIPDSFSTAQSSPTTPTQKSTVKVTPAKRLRFELPEDKENITPGRTKPKSPKPIIKSSGRKPLQEVPDSDEDLETEDDDADTEVETEEPDTPSKRPRDHTSLVEDPEPPETYYDEFGEETQAELISSHHQPSDELGADMTPELTVAPELRPKTSPHVDHEEEEDRPVSSPPSIIGPTPVTSPQKMVTEKNPRQEDVSAAQDLMYTQGLESQRLPLDAIHALGPQTPRSDIMVSLHPEHVGKILDRTKDHEFRAWKIPPEVLRVWVYITKPVHELKYMCVFGPPKVPGEIQDERGVGNADFNQGRKIMKYAYEVLQVYQLNNPVSLEEMKNKGWVAAAPQKYAFIPPAVVGELTANLRCALFGGTAGDPLPLGSPRISESQELQAQLQSDADYSTQHRSFGNADADDDVVPSSQTPRKPAAHRSDDTPFLKPALPKTQSSSSAPDLPALPSQKSQGLDFVRPSQATTASQSSSSSSPSSSPGPGPSPQKSAARPIIDISSQSRRSEALLHTSSSSPAAGHRHQQHVHSSLRSSQFLTRSQMLPDSIVNQEFEEPPPIIWDSADELSE